MVRSSQGASSSSYSQRQRRADTGVWPCTLDGCSKVFAREADLKRHQRTTKSHLVPGSTAGSPCPLCEATFTRTDAMRRHLKSRHNGKTPESLYQAATQSLPSTSSSSRGKRRESPVSDTSELSVSDGEQQIENHRSEVSSRAQSAAPAYYQPTHAPPPPSNLSPAILYQAAMSYEIRHALASSTPTSPLSEAHVPHSPTARSGSQSNAPRSDVYPQVPGHQLFTQYPADEYTYHNQHQQQAYGTMSHQQPQQYTPGSHAAPIYTNGLYGSSRNSGSPSPYAQHAWESRQGANEGSSSTTIKSEQSDGGSMSGNRRSGRRGAHSPRSPFTQHEPPPSGLAALAMHAARIRPMSPLPNAKQTVKTKSELESALGPPYSR